MRKLFAALAAACLLSACTTTNTVPIAPDVFRLDTDASGYLFTGTAGSDSLYKAAQITKQKGYSYFIIADGNSAAGSTVAGATANRFGSAIFATPVYAPTQQVSITVQMLNKPQQGAWNVDEVIAKKGKMF